MATIIIRNGNQASLSGASASQGEPLFTNDEGLLYVHDGSNKKLIGRVLRDTYANRPAAAIDGRLFYATDTGDTYLDDGGSWQLVGANDLASLNGDLDDISDGTNYQRVAASEVDASGYVTQINDGANTVTAAQARTHIDTADIHRVQNDSQTTTTNLWSANKIQNTIDTAVTGLTWEDPVSVPNLISDADQGGSPPAASAGDAYIVNNWGGGYNNGDLVEYDGAAWQVIESNSGGNPADGLRAIIVGIDGTGAAGSFSGQDDDMAEYSTTGGWSFDTPADGSAVIAIGDGSYYENLGYVYEGAKTAPNWVQFTGAGQINAGVGLAKSGNTLSVRLGAGIKELPTGEVGIDLSAGGGLQLTGTATGDTLEIDPDTESGGDIQPVNLTANGTGLDIAAIAGTGLEADGSANLRLATQGNGIAGGAGSVLSADVNAAGAISNDFNANGDLGVLVDDTTIEISGNALQVKAVDPTLIDSVIAGEGLVYNPTDGSLDVNVDDSTLEVSADTVQVKDDGVTAAKINADVAGDGLVPNGGTGALDVNPGNGIDLSADAVIADVNAAGAISNDFGASGELGVLVDDTSIEISGNALQIKAVDPTLVDSAIAGDGLVYNPTDGSLDVDVDTVTGGNVSQALSVTSDGVGVKIDNSSIKENGSQQLYVDTVDGGSL